LTKNTLGDLNDHLFEQLERLNDNELKGDELKEEISRAKAVANIASQIIQNGNLVLRAKTFMHEYEDGGEDGSGKKKLPPALKANFLE
jgi:hypothetical protein